MGNDQRRALLAVVLSGLILFGWQYFYGPKTPVGAVKKESSQTKVVTGNSEQNEGKATISNGKVEVAPVEISNITLENDNHSYELNSQLTVVSSLFKETDSQMKSFFGPSNNSVKFLVGDIFKTINFKLSKTSDTTASFSNSELGLNGTVTLGKKGFLNYEILGSKPFSFRFGFKESKKDKDGGGFLSMSAGSSIKQFGYFTDDYNVLALDSSENGEAMFRWFSVDNDYHIFANVLEDKTSMLFKTNENGTFSATYPESTSKLRFKQVFARKEYDQLGALGYNLDKSIDFGIWGVIAVPILRGLQFFYSVIPNYGISIIFLTIIIRMLTFPLQFKSFKSMKKMQEIQPELTRLKEKYKNDPQRMQQETMTLFKRAGANPLGGCLPMILQMPIFFAFYKVLYSSVELVDAPFFGWIQDLSQKDPYYVLPILMGLAMVLNQKLMPSTVSDPVQKKVMLFMPLIFAVFMKDFPAGLTLYIFISTLMGMGQQLFVYKRT